MARRSTSAIGFDWARSNASAALTMWHRLSCFGAVAAMSETERQVEGARMVGEKIAAAYEGGFKAGLEAMRMVAGTALGAKPHANATAAIVDAALRPAFRKARANASRLKRRAVRKHR